jgi:alpha-beta hydrolase superfamily lysophospholipase
MRADRLKFSKIAKLFISTAVCCSVITGCGTTYKAFNAAEDRTVPAYTAPRIPVMVNAAAAGKLSYIENHDGIKIPIYVYGSDKKGTPVLMVHGLQSHSGWFVQSAKAIADSGHPVYQIDRRGSGMSREPRGHADSYKDMVDDIHTVAEVAMQKHNSDKIHLLGHCFGAIPSTAFACRYPKLLQSLMLCTPAIYTRTDVYFGQKVRILESELTHHYKYIPINIKPEQFTDSPLYLKYIRNDKLTLKEVTSELYYQVPAARSYIKKHSDRLTMPVFFGMAAKDTICDNAKDRTFFNALPSGRKELIVYSKAKHILEYCDDRDLFFRDVTAWINNSEPISETETEK